MYHPTTRVLTVLELLQSHQRISGPELADRLEVDVRTARRYITMLQDLGIPIEAERGRYGAYRLRPGFKLPPLMFNEDEALALTLGLLAARRMNLALATPAVEGALAKIERVLPHALRERVQAVLSTLAIDLSSRGAPPSSALLLTFSAGAQQQRCVWMRYRSGRTQETERAVEPYGLVYREGRWYVVGHCRLRGGMRVFRLDRVVEAELRPETFARPPDFDALAFLAHSFATMPGTWAVRVRLELPLEQARQRLAPELGTLEADGETATLLRCYSENLDWMARFLVGLGCPLTVLQPPELREALRSLARTILDENAEQ